NILQEKRDIILGIANKHGIKNVQVFGSVARLEDNSASDIDLLVEFENGRSLFDLIRFKQEVEDLLNTKVDVVTENAIHWSMKKDDVYLRHILECIESIESYIPNGKCDFLVQNYYKMQSFEILKL